MDIYLCRYGSNFIIDKSLSGYFLFASCNCLLCVVSRDRK